MLRLSRWVVGLLAASALGWVSPCGAATNAPKPGHGAAQAGRSTPAKPAPGKMRSAAKPGTSACSKAKSGQRACKPQAAAEPAPVAMPPGDAAQSAAAPPRAPNPGSVRAYAVEGDVFYHQGQRIRVQGLGPTPQGTHDELAKQRLQRALDSGEVSVEATGRDDAGNTVGIVRVNGRDVVELMKLDALMRGDGGG